MLRNAKIVATIGPSSNTPGVLREMIAAGMDVARLNFSHGTHEEHAAVIASLRQLSVETSKPITILLDMQGPKIRVGELAQPIDLIVGHTVALVSRPIDPSIAVDRSSDITRIPMDFPELPQSASMGSSILLDDGRLELEVTRITDDSVEGIVRQGGLLTSHKGVNLPGAVIPIPGFTPKDRSDLEFGLAQGVDAVAISFVRTAADVEVVRHAIREFAPQQADTLIVAKLERPEALDNLDDILDKADGVMVARGDLGVEMSPATVPIAQKKIIEAANQHSKFVITATQMLESMMINPRPTRAEASDVANAIFDGTDAVMLSGETASGKFPVETVKMMDAIVCQAEDHFSEWGHCEPPAHIYNSSDAVSMTNAARELAHDRNVAAIAVFTQTGHTALLMSKARPRVSILAFTPIERVYRRLGIYWGVVPFLTPFASTIEEMIRLVELGLVSATSIKPGQQVVVISGFPVGHFRQPNFALLHSVGEATSD